MRRALLIAGVLLLVASSAHAQKRIGLIGDSHVVGGVSFASLGSFVSRWSIDVTMRDILAQASGTWANAHVENWGVPGTSQDDWLADGPSEAALCAAEFDPWICCTGSGTGSSCICDSGLVTQYPHLKAACRDRAPMTNYLPSGVDRWILIPDGSPAGGDTATPEAIAAAVDRIEALAAVLDTLDAGDGVVVTSPLHFDGGCVLGAFTYDTIHAEMVSRGDVITSGFDLYNGPALTRCPDFIHPTDVGYALVGDFVARGHL